MASLRSSLALVLCAAVVACAMRAAPDPEDNSARYLLRDLVKLTDEGKEGVWPLLTLDGGGLRGIVTTEVLIEVENAIKKALVALDENKRTPHKKYSSPNEFEIDLADYFNGIAGVSTGSWIACYLASRGGKGSSKRVFDSKSIVQRYGQIRAGSVEGLRVFFKHYAKQLYPAFSIPITWSPKLWRPWILKVAGYNRPRYPVQPLEATLDLFLGQTSYLETGNTTLMTLTYDLIRKAAVFFVADHTQVTDPQLSTFIMTNEKEPRSTKTYSYTAKSIKGKNFFMKDIARASSASPTVFEAKKFSALNDESFKLCAIDGTLMANNPTLISSYFLLENGIGMDSLSILSIGMCISTGRYRKHSESGAYQWFVTSNDFLAIMMDGGSEYIQTVFASVYYNQLPSKFDKGPAKRYLRVQLAFDSLTPEGEALSQMYDSSIMDELQGVGTQLVARYKDEITLFVEQYVVNLEGSAKKSSSL